MSRLPRPHIPSSVKIDVVCRQLRASDVSETSLWRGPNERKKDYLERLLMLLAASFGCPRDQLRLDHEPALENRVKVKHHGNITRYRPDANDPDWLSYRPHAPEFSGSHLIKTNVRGDHGQHSDRALAAKNKNIAKNRDPKRRKAKIAQRKNPWPKGRKFQTRRKR